MDENLNVGDNISSNDNATNNGIIEKWCYNNDTWNCMIYGGLYQWDEMMQYNPQDTGTIGTTQGICPDGWHIPTEKEWHTMIDYLGGDTIAGGKLKETGTIHWAEPNIGATNESGFTGLPGGTLSADKIFYDIRNFAAWWSTTKNVNSTDIAIFYYLLSDYVGIFSSVNGLNDTGFSVRCVKNP